MEDDGMATLIVAMVLMGMATFVLGMLVGMCLMPMPWQLIIGSAIGKPILQRLIRTRTEAMLEKQ